jgi:transcriptional regulator with PAS, ATPase and Fis domain
VLVSEADRLYVECVRPQQADGQAQATALATAFEAFNSSDPVLCKAAGTGGLDILWLPLAATGRCCGVVGVEAAFSGGPPADGVKMAAALCGFCATHIDNLREREQLKRQCLNLHEAVQASHRFVGSSPALQRVYGAVGQAAGAEFPVLVTGETGTGKELAAKAVHNLSRRGGKPYIICNCVAVPESLIEAELFGYAPLSGIANANPKGKLGRFQLADGGTIFLDEVGDFSPETQVKLLRVLEDFVVEPLGSTQPVRVDVRVIAATNRDLKAMIARGSFREDLYHRLNVLHVLLPPLRERAVDILLLAAYFLETVVAPPLNEEIEITKDAAAALLSYRWPGNVRELRNEIVRAAYSTTTGRLEPEQFALDGSGRQQALRTLRQAEKEHIEVALKAANGNKRKAAQMLDISPQTLYDKIKDYKIDSREGDTKD